MGLLSAARPLDGSGVGPLVRADCCASAVAGVARDTIAVMSTMRKSRSRLKGLAAAEAVRERCRVGANDTAAIIIPFTMSLTRTSKNVDVVRKSNANRKLLEIINGANNNVVSLRDR